MQSVADILTLMDSEVVSKLGWSRAKIAPDEVSPYFGDCSAVLENEALRIRLVRERRAYFVEFGSVARPHEWFDAAVVMEHLGFGPEGGFHGADAQMVLRGLADFLRQAGGELNELFSADRFAESKEKLLALVRIRALRTYGA